MIIAKNDEEQRSRIWRIVTITATIVIIVVATYFLFTLFGGNPLEGTWASEESNLRLTIRKGTAATAAWPEIGETSNVKVNLRYTLDKEDKTIAFKLDSKEIDKAVEASDDMLTREAVIAEAGVLENTFDYNLAQDVLTLSEREYGEQMTFIKE